MPIELLVIGFVLAGIVMAFRLRGQVARKVAKGYAIGISLVFGGCAGSLGWLDAETSGRKSILTDISPLVYLGLLVGGAIVLVVTSIRVFRNQPQPKTKPPDGESE